MKYQNCLNCKYEPDWNDWIGTEYRRCYGKCKCPVILPVLPKVYRISIEMVERFSDDSGIVTHCKAWKPKK